ncbi:MAG TPA: hypothetical protein VHW69_12005 [Rhizomicrobium sp.]|jgi:hypothetical protein|nr:hypothetical protein [Rhizomicrobium sp.]
MRIFPAAVLTTSILAFTLAAQAQSQSPAPPNTSVPAAGSNSAASPPPNPLSTILTKLTDMPPGWTRNMDGSYRQAQADVRCPMNFKSFNFQRFQPLDTDRPDVLGICYYGDGTGRVGSIRVRSYKGSNDKSVLAENDKLLMAKDGAPPLLLHTGIDSKTGGGRSTATVSRNGLLVDCSVWQPEHSVPRSDFLLYCTTLTGS